MVRHQPTANIAGMPNLNGDSQNKPSTKASLVGLVVWLGLCFAAAGCGAAASIHAASFYQEMVRPTWAPPGWLFGPVWSLLYALMGIAAWMVWRVGGFRAARVALVLFVMQLLVNAGWSWLFFAWHSGLWSMVDIVVLDVFVIATIVHFWRVQRGAALLLMPYLLWIAFATVLNWAMWQANPGLLG
jgi:translocator protein